MFSYELYEVFRSNYNKERMQKGASGSGYSEQIMQHP